MTSTLLSQLYRCLTLICLMVLFLGSPTALAGGAPPSKSDFKWEESTIKEVATQFVLTVGKDDFQSAYNSGGDVLRELRTVDEFAQDM